LSLLSLLSLRRWDLDPKELLERLREAGAVLTATGDGDLRVDAHGGLPPAPLLAGLLEQQAALVALVDGGGPVPPSQTTGRAPWHDKPIRIEDLPEFLTRYGLEVVGGDPDLTGHPWWPKVYLGKKAREPCPYRRKVAHAIVGAGLPRP
jgi:hypothetical protein